MVTAGITLIELVVAPVDHRILFEQLVVKVTDCPPQVLSIDAVIVGA